MFYYYYSFKLVKKVDIKIWKGKGKNMLLQNVVHCIAKKVHANPGIERAKNT
jgi:hypothetical protein